MEQDKTIQDGDENPIFRPRPTPLVLFGLGTVYLFIYLLKVCYTITCIFRKMRKSDII